MKNKKNWCLLGIPDHQGVTNVGGRIGAAHGPSALRKVFSRFKGRDGVREALHDLGDLSGLGQDVAENHRRAAAWVRKAQQQSGLTVVIGGGHDHGYSHLWGIRDSYKADSKSKPKIGCINVDAHLDVRKAEPVITSGSPFYLAIESGVIEPRSLIEFGIQSHCNASELWDYVDRKKVSVVRFEKLRHGKAPELFQRH